MRIVTFGEIKPINMETECCGAIIDVLPIDATVISNGKVITTCPVCGEEIEINRFLMKKCNWHKSKLIIGGGVTL